jgi:hypothetical protein
LKVIGFFFLAVLVLFLALPGIRTSLADKRKVSHSKAEVASIPDSLFQSGDLVFRDGRGIVSSFFKKFSLKDPRYSHAGILHRKGNQLFVYHLEEEVSGTDSRMRLDLINKFCSESQSNSFAIYRTTLPGARIDSIAENYYHSGIKFDTHFDLTTDSKMYCTEFLYKVLMRASGKDNFIPLTEFSGKKYSACDNLYTLPGTKMIFSHTYSTR